MMRRTVGEKGQVVIPIDIRKHLDIKSGSEIVFEIRDHDTIIRKSNIDPEQILNDFCNIPKTSRRNVDVKKIKKMLEKQHEEEYHDLLHRR